MFVRRVYVYSSETGLWTLKRLLNSRPVNHPPVNLNGTLYMWERRVISTKHEVIVSFDFYGPEDDDQCQVIPLPDPSEFNQINGKRCLTTSGGDVIYIVRRGQKLKHWRMNDNSENGWWQLSREINMAWSFSFSIPIAMNPFDTDIVYLWRKRDHCLVTGNLQTQEFIVHQESEKWTSSEGCCHINTCDCNGYMEATHDVSHYIIPVCASTVDGLGAPSTKLIVLFLGSW
ncbi:PREDICTED: F-box protein At1g49990-like [Camelina sativa]|uniref:F-box protein At1g49990-like n=1 Tax=Camelina sativa TaxID=90675 RepID=A0ABM0VVX1_CAMSA|nr:PREDICTED: F-box protein At1g49990-like [Camelina sativa]